MEFKVYGHTGKPILVFPTSRGKFYQYEDSGMIGAISSFIENGSVQVWACDGIDGETLLGGDGHTYDRVQLHERYMKYINEEMIPYIKHKSKEFNNGYEHKLMATGCSFGAYHAANTFFRFPEHFDSVIALSGVYSSESFLGDYMDDTLYFNSPVHYLSNLTDEWFLNRYRESKIVICCGRGSYEDLMLKDTLRMQEILSAKDTGAWVDIWGGDVNHDWDWWRKQMPYFLGKYFDAR
jgi:esterase/lipase superfamily enzyme